MRLPVATSLQSRDGALTKDAQMVNCFAEIKGDQSAVFRRPGLLQSFDLTAGAGQGLVCWNNTLYAVKANTVTQGPTAAPYPNGSAWTSQGTITAPSNIFTYNTYYDLASDTFWLAINTAVYKQVGSSNWATTTSSSGNDRIGAMMPVFVSKVWMLGGKSAFSTATNTIYNSTDGITWTSQGTAAWARRSNAHVYFLGSTMYVYGGIDDTSGVFTYYGDLWKTTDGINWTQVTGHGLPTDSASAASAYSSTRILVMVGTAVYSSTDGITFTLQTSNAGFTVGQGRMAYFDGNFYAFTSGGACYISTNNGGAWTQTTASPPFTSSVNCIKGSSTALRVNQGSSGTQTIWEATVNTAGGHNYTLSGSQLPINFNTTSGAASQTYLVIKNTDKAWVLTFGSPGTLTQVTDADYPAATVPGIVYLDGYFFVMDDSGTIYNSDLEAPLSWNPLNFIQAEIEPDVGIAIAKHQNYVVALKQNTTELFYDAANATGSPLASVQPAAIQIGCANGYSLAQVDGALYFMSRTSSQQPSVHMFPADSYTPVEIADENVQRILAVSALTTVYAWAARLSGHSFYVLDLADDDLTLAYDLTSKTWGIWTLRTAQAAQTLTSLTQSNGIATATKTAHGYADGDLITIAGATPSGYNGSFNVTVTDANTFTYSVSSALATPATGTITATGYTEGHFPIAYFTACSGGNYVQHESNGKIYQISRAYLDDVGAYIDMRARSGRFDGDDAKLRKRLPVMTYVGDNVSADLLVRYTDDDYSTYSQYRPIALSDDKPQLRRLGGFWRRAFEFRYTGSPALRMSGADVEVEA